MSPFYDVVRHLVEHGPWATDTDRETALQAVTDHEQLHELQASIAHEHIDPQPLVDQAPAAPVPVPQPAAAAYEVGALVPPPVQDPVTVTPDWQ